jgi:N-methylhydantoinase B
MDEAFLRLFLANCRIPDQNWGDLRALLSSLHTADTRIKELVARYGREAVLDGIEAVLDYGERRARALISDLPDGDYEFVDYLEADMTPVGLIRIKLTLRIKGDEITFDFTGTDPQVQAAMNLPSNSHRGHWMIVIGAINYFRTVDPSIPYNSGLVRPLGVVAPRGSLVNPEPPAACGVRAATQFRILDMTMGALGRVVPSIVPAAGAGQISIALVATPDIADGEYKVSVLQPLCGGSGGRPNKDGIEAGDFCTFLRNIPNETLEHDLPIVIERYGLRPDSGGAGEQRGGSGVEFSFQLLSPTAVVTARGMERYRFPPWGRRGGNTGTTGLTLLRHAEEEAESIGKIDVLYLKQGDTLSFFTQGGGGFGDPLARQPERVLADVVRGLVSVEAAEQGYGVVIRDGAIDREATRAVRSARAGERETGEYTLGAARIAYDLAWPGEVQEALNASVAGYPVSLRGVAREEMLKELRPLASGRGVTRDDVAVASARLQARWQRAHLAAVRPGMHGALAAAD